MKTVLKSHIKKTIKKTGSWTGYIAPRNVPEGNVKEGWGMGRLTTITELSDTLMVDNNAYTLDYLLTHLKANNVRNGLDEILVFWEEISAKKVTMKYIEETVRTKGQWTGYMLPSNKDSKHIHEGQKMGIATTVIKHGNTLMVKEQGCTLDHFIQDWTQYCRQNGISRDISFWELTN
ncbi:hypothetical protein ACQUY5_29275 [Bacillus cereus]|uniref:hypothetical protein n=1 Tax=Bacillus cereus TaxID=1396 RepID=UPI003D167763